MDLIRVPSTFSQVRPQRDLRSVGPHQQIAGKASQDAEKDFPRLVAMSSNQINHQRENSVDSCRSDDENGYDNFGEISSYRVVLMPFRKTKLPISLRKTYCVVGRG